MVSFDEYYNDIGYKIYDDLVEWLEDAPDVIDVDELVGDIEKYAMDIVEQEYESLVSSYEDFMYDSWKDDMLMGED